MKYYIIKWDYDNTDIIGHNPQIEYDKENNFNSSDNIRKVKPYEFPNFSLKLNLKFHKKGKITNLIQSPDTNEMYIDEKFESILMNYNLPDNRFHQLRVDYRGNLLSFYWFQFLSNDFWNFIDKNKSIVEIIDNKQDFTAVSTLDLNMNLDELKEYITFDLPYYQNCKWKKIVFNNSFPKYDVYRTEIIDYSIIISERLLNALLDANMTGFTTKLFDVIEFE